MKFNPQIGDTIVTKERGNFICANYEEYVESKDLIYRPEYASAHICGVRKNGDGFMTWNEYGRCLEDEYYIAEIIPQKKTSHPNPGDIIVTRNNLRWICMQKEDYESKFNVGSFPEVIFAKSERFGIGSHMRWKSFDGKADRDEYDIAEVIPAQKPEIKITAEISHESKIKILELENARQRHRGWRFAMLRMLLRKEGVDV